MNTTLSTSKHLKLLNTLQSSTCISRSSFLHLLRFSAEPRRLSDHQNTDDSIINQALQLLQIPDNQWNPAQINHLLFSSSSDSPHSPHLFFQITSRLPSHSQAIKFLKFLREHAPELGTEHLSFTLQAVIDLASGEIDSPADLYELYKASKEWNVPITANSAINLLCCFRRGGLLEESLVLFNELDDSVKNIRICNILMPSLLKAGRFDDALKVLDEMLQPDCEFHPNDLTGGIIFTWLIKSIKEGKKIISDEKVLELVSRLGEYSVFPRSISLTQMISSLCRNRKSIVANKLLFELIRQGADLATAPCNALLTGLGREGNIDGMNKVMAKMKELDIEPNVVTYEVIIKQLCKLRRVDGALGMFETMNEALVEPDVILFNTLIDGLCKVERQEEGLCLMEKMKLRKGCDPNTVTYNCLIDGFCKVGEIERGLELFSEMKKQGVIVNEITVNTLVDGMCRNGRTSGAAQFVEEMQAEGFKCSAFAYTCLINAYGNVNNIGKAMECIQQMMKEGISVDAMVYYSLINGLCKAGKMHDAMVVFSKMKKDGFVPDILCYNVLISELCTRNKIDEAYKLLGHMEEDKVEPDCITYNSLIAYFGKRGDLGMVRRLMKRMIKDDVPPTVFTYGAAIHAFCLKGKIDEAITILKNMDAAASKVAPNTEIYNILIGSLCKNDSVERALSLLDDMIVKDVKPNAITFNSIFKVFREQNSLVQAFDLMVKMKEQGVNPDYITLEVLTEWLSDAGETERLKNFLEG